ncbi:MAG: DNA polymerase I [Candidatus Omnitrophica bacterium]|nr:DNA polymerase I [Candidatus Omnitrophota bacterium]
MSDKRLYLIDATAFCYRAFYALSGLATSLGQPTNAIYGFVGILNKILKDNKPDYIAVCFDVSRDTFRQKKFADYKLNRPPMPDGLKSQLSFIKDIVRAWGLTIFEKEGFEADDIIATLAKKAKEHHLPVTIVSSDKDILQLVDENVLVYSPYKDTGTLYDNKKVLERFEIEPKQIADVITLMGDSVDNIPGVPGIGEKTAVSLVKEFGSSEELLKNIDKVKKEKIREALKENIERVKINKELVLLDKNVDLKFDLNLLKVSQPDSKELVKLFKALEFRKFIKDLSLENDLPEDVLVNLLKDKELREYVSCVDELVLFGNSIDDLVFFAREEFFRVEAFGENIKQLLSDPRVKKIGHDLKKLKILFANNGIILEGINFDTMIAGYLLNPAKTEYGLSSLAWDYLDRTALDDLTDSAQAVKLIVNLRPRLQEQLKDKGLIDLFNNIEMPLVSVLAEMELSGIKIDEDILKKLSLSLEKRLNELIKHIYSLSGVEFNINSPKQLREVLFERLKLPVGKRTKTGPSTDEEVLKNLAVKHELPAHLLEYRQLTKLKNTYIDALPLLVDKKTGKIHASFNQTGTETGRLSSSNPNLQNIPVKMEIGRNIRRAIISSGKDYRLLSCDYSQIELRVLAHLSKDEVLIDAFKSNKDIHKATAALIYNVEEKEVSNEMREVAKRINFGIVYGLSSWGLSRDLGLAVNEAQNFIDAYFLRYPKVRTFIDEEIRQASERGFVTTISGRRRYLPEINSKNIALKQLAQRQAVNTPIQGSASDLIKMAMVSINKEIKENKLQAKMIMQIHDELVFDLPVKESSRVEKLVGSIMENVLKLDVPIKVDVKSGLNWQEMEEVL